MVFGGGKRTQAKELKAKLEEILSLLDALPADQAAGDGEGPEEAPEKKAALDQASEAVQAVTQRINELASAHQQLTDQYAEFVRGAQGLQD